MSIKPVAGHFSILYFAAASSYTGRHSDSFEAPLSLLELFELLESRYPGIRTKVLNSSAVTINLDYVGFSLDANEEGYQEQAKGEELIIQEGDEVAIIPPTTKRKSVFLWRLDK
ncbi:MAG: hypothetical protein M1835_000782 [Candelina submexicana]|nr:MAG: hypothetical protein M1835_000782 [Candelina submexicana]